MQLGKVGGRSISKLIKARRLSERVQAREKPLPTANGGDAIQLSLALKLALERIGSELGWFETSVRRDKTFSRNLPSRPQHRDAGRGCGVL